MTTTTHAPRSMGTRSPSGTRGTEGRPALLITALLVAAALVFVVLLWGPALSAAVSIPLALAAIGIVIAGWVVAGPRE